MQSLTVLALLAGPSCVTTQETGPLDDPGPALQEIEATVSGASIETDLSPIQLAGQLVYQSTNGGLKSVQAVTVQRQDHGREPYLVDLPVDATGHFSKQVSLLVCRSPSGRHGRMKEWPERAVFIFNGGVR